MSCPTHDELERFALGFSTDDSAAQKHVDTCDACAAALKSLKENYDVLSVAAKRVMLPKVAEPRRRPAVWQWVTAAACLALAVIGAGMLFVRPAPQTAPVPQTAKDSLALNSGVGTMADTVDYEHSGRSRVRPGSSDVMDHKESEAVAKRTGQKLGLKPEPATPPPAPVQGGGYQGPLTKPTLPRDPTTGLHVEEVPPPDPAAKQPPAVQDATVLAILKNGEERKQKGDLQGAIEDYTRAIRISPDLAEAYKNRGEVRRKLGDAKGAEEDFARARDMTFKAHGINPAIETAKEPLSTFGLDVSTASFTVVRNFLMQGQLPPAEAVRVEEFLNYFRYNDEPPTGGPAFAIRLEAAPSPFDKEMHLLRVGIKAKEIKAKDRKDLLLALVIDVSGSMREGNRLGTVKRSLHYLVDQLRPTDRVGIVIFSTDARKLLDLTPVAQKDKILAIIDELEPQNSTNTEAGLKLGYEMALTAFDREKTNRVVLCTDGVANVGVTNPTAILAQHKDTIAKGVYLTCVGVGMGNFNDAFLEKLATSGNGQYAYFDTFDEARKVFGEKLLGTMEVVAVDAKVQAEFDPDTVATWRLIGYEKRHIANEDFRNDKVDAGEVGAGHHVTALYEIALKPGSKGRVVTVRVRFGEPGNPKEVSEDHQSIGMPQVLDSVKDASASYRLAAAVMQFAEILRGSDRVKGITLAQVQEQAQAAAVEMDKAPDGLELVELVKKAAELRK